ncbi:MAG TPA: hypothetical protein VJ997_12915, partial [Longimicrobiales bacterium]|nr:hypothetical protein [Longimicrobiales bacterium]
RGPPGRQPGARSIRALQAGALALLLSVAGVFPASAQDDAPLYLAVHPENGALEIRIGDLFADPGLVQALHSGLPVRIQIVVGLWKDGFFDSEKGRGEWRASVLFDPLEQRYRVGTGGEGATEVAVDSLGAVGEALQAGFDLPLRPREEGKYYYLGQVQVETLSLSDLEELQRWLQGDLAVAVRGEENVGTAVGRGMHRMVVRMLGIPAKRFKVRTESFRVESRPPS